MAVLCLSDAYATLVQLQMAKLLSNLFQQLTNQPHLIGDYCACFTSSYSENQRPKSLRHSTCEAPQESSAQSQHTQHFMGRAKTQQSETCDNFKDDGFPSMHTA